MLNYIHIVTNHSPDYTDYYVEIFDYLSAPEAPETAHPAIVFGRDDVLIARKAGELAAANLLGPTIITGGVGKDTGRILEQGFRSEASFLDHNLQRYAAEHNTPLPQLTLEEKAVHGGENTAFSLRMLNEQGVALSTLTSVAHATSSRRLAAGIDFHAQTKLGFTPKIYRVPTDYSFDPHRRVDQDEAAAELLRLADWPAKGILLPQKQLPENLVDFVHNIHGEAPKPPRAWQAHLLRTLPAPLRRSAIRIAAKHKSK